MQTYKGVIVLHTHIKGSKQRLRTRPNDASIIQLQYIHPLFVHNTVHNIPYIGQDRYIMLLTKIFATIVSIYFCKWVKIDKHILV